MTARTYEPPDPDVLAWVVRQVHPRARVSGVERLLGGITADMDRITLESPAGATDVVLRRWATESSELVEQEAAALTAIEGSPVPAPVLLATGTSCTLTTALPGQPDLTPADLAGHLHRLAAAQAAIHALPAVGRSVEERYAFRDRTLEWITDTGLREAAREAADGDPPTAATFVHGDYQPFNVLWHGGRLTGVVDWPHAGTGNRGTDVGHCRLNLAVLFDAATASAYLAQYERAAGVRVDRGADLRSLLCFDLDWQEFIPVQVAGRARVDVPGMPGRVTEAVRLALESL